MRQNACLCELTGRSEAVAQLLEEPEVNKDLLVHGAVERSGFTLGSAASGLRRSRNSTSLVRR